MNFLNKGHQFFMYQQMSFMYKSIKHKFLLNSFALKMYKVLQVLKTKIKNYLYCFDFTHNNNDVTKMSLYDKICLLSKKDTLSFSCSICILSHWLPGQAYNDLERENLAREKA